MEDDEEKDFLDEMRRKGVQIMDGAFLNDRWTAYCRQQQDTYLAMLFGYKRRVLKLHKVLHRTLRSEKAVRQALLLARCEAHQEVLSAIFREARHRR